MGWTVGICHQHLSDPQEVVAHYTHLWQIEKAFRISKADLRVRPVHHHLRQRIEAHISIAFAAYTIYKEAEHLLKVRAPEISPRPAVELTHTMYALRYTNPDTNEPQQNILGMDPEQQRLCDAIIN